MYAKANLYVVVGCWLRLLYEYQTNLPCLALPCSTAAVPFAVRHCRTASQSQKCEIIIKKSFTLLRSYSSIAKDFCWRRKTVRFCIANPIPLDLQICIGSDETTINGSNKPTHSRQSNAKTGWKESQRNHNQAWIKTLIFNCVSLVRRVATFSLFFFSLFYFFLHKDTAMSVVGRDASIPESPLMLFSLHERTRRFVPCHPPQPCGCKISRDESCWGGFSGPLTAHAAFSLSLCTSHAHTLTTKPTGGLFEKADAKISDFSHITFFYLFSIYILLKFCHHPLSFYTDIYWDVLCMRT